MMDVNSIFEVYLGRGGQWWKMFGPEESGRKVETSAETCNLNSSGLVRLMSRLCGHFAAACNKTRLNPIARSNTAASISIFIYAYIHTHIYLYVCNFVTMITRCFKSLFNCKATPSITQINISSNFKILISNRVRARNCNATRNEHFLRSYISIITRFSNGMPTKKFPRSFYSTFHVLRIYNLRTIWKNGMSISRAISSKSHLWNRLNRNRWKTIEFVLGGDKIKGEFFWSRNWGGKHARRNGRCDKDRWKVDRAWVTRKEKGRRTGVVTLTRLTSGLER